MSSLLRDHETLSLTRTTYRDDDDLNAHSRRRPHSPLYERDYAYYPKADIQLRQTLCHGPSVRIVEAPLQPPTRSACHCRSASPRWCCCRHRTRDSVAGEDHDHDQEAREPARDAAAACDSTIIRVQNADGNAFNISVRSSTTVSDILAYLAADEREIRVLVRWRSGETEPLDERTGMEQVRRKARHLVVQRRPRVRFT